jgi:hypothetical protein
MQLKPRQYAGEDDFWRIRAYLREVLPLNQYRENCWHVARFDYWCWHGVANIEQVNLEDVVFIWETPEGHIAAVLNPEGMGEAFLQVHPSFGTPELQAEMIDVAEAKLAVSTPEGKRKLRVWVEEHDSVSQAILQRCGYTKGAWPEYMRQQPIQAPTPDGTPAPGYVIRSLGDGLELIERCYASGLAFHENDIRIAVNNRDVTWYRNIQTAPL